MDRAASRILKSIVQTHGLAFTQSKALCKAYLADLMPNFVEERQQLVAAVAYELPHKLLESHTYQQRNILALQFGQASSIPPRQALQVVNAWLYALQDFSSSKQTSTWCYWGGWTSYWGGLIVGFIILLLGTAIAVYKKPEFSPLVQQAEEKNSLSSSSALPDLNSTVVTPSVHFSSKPLPSSQNTQILANLLFSPLATNWTKLDNLEAEQETTQTLLPFLFKDQYQSSKQDSHTTIPKAVTTRSNAAPINRQLNVPNSLAAQAQLKKPNKPSTKATTAQSTSQTQSHSRAKRVETQKAFDQTSQSIQVLAENILGLRKKQAERHAISELLKLTRDNFYTEQLTALDQQIQVFNLRIDHLSAAYSKQVVKLCELAPTVWQDEPLTTKKAHSKQIHALLLQHWQACKSLSSQQIKQQVLSYY